VAGCSAAPPKARNKRASKKEKAKSSAGDASYPTICPANTKSLESSKRKRKASEDVSDVEIQAASSSVKLSRKKSKKAVKNVVATVVQCVPSTISDEEMIEEPHRIGFFSRLCCELRFGVRRDCTPSSENDFVDIETFSDIVPEALDAPIDSFVVASTDAGTSKTAVAGEEASPKFIEDLERTVS
jgi:hypothetical protein